MKRSLGQANYVIKQENEKKEIHILNWKIG